MIKCAYVVVNGTEYFNVEDPHKELIGFTEEGKPIFEERKILPETEEELRKIVDDTILTLAKLRLEKILSKYRYNGLGDVQLYAAQSDTEAQAILNWYTNAKGNGYDDLIWSYIDSLPNKTKADILNDLQDLIAVEESIFQQAVQNNPLP